MKQLFNFTSNSYSRFLKARNKNPIPSFDEVPRIDEDIRYQTNFFHSVYIKKKNIHSLHQGIFFGLGILFLLLAGVIYSNTTNCACSVFFNQCAYVKPGAYTLSVLLALFTGLIGYYGSPEREAAHFLIGRKEKKLKHMYKQKKVLDVYSLFSTETDAKTQIDTQRYKQTLQSIRAYKETIIEELEKIILLKDETLLTKEQLIRKTFYDSNKHLEEIIRSFSSGQDSFAS